jgi:hypothetical protein
MIDRTRTGKRCRAVRFVRTVEGDLFRDARGTVSYEIENLDRQLVLVRWDKGVTVPVFPHEIEIFEENEVRA